jgi:predicted permease
MLRDHPLFPDSNRISFRVVRALGIILVPIVVAWISVDIGWKSATPLTLIAAFVTGLGAYASP